VLSPAVHHADLFLFGLSSNPHITFMVFLVLPPGRLAGPAWMPIGAWQR
jgi:hypothetical protein